MVEYACEEFTMSMLMLSQVVQPGELVNQPWCLRITVSSSGFGMVFGLG